MRSPLYSCRCSVCLADYQAEDRLQQIPACGHTFHMDCIDHWLTSHSTCPLCRLSLLPSTKSSIELQHIHVETSQEYSVAVNCNDASVQPRPHAWEETQAIQISESSHGDLRLAPNNFKEDARNSDCFDHEREFRGSRYDTERHEPNDGFSGNFWFVAHKLNLSLSHLLNFNCILFPLLFKKNAAGCHRKA